MAHNPEGPLNQSRPPLLLTRPMAQSQHFADAFRVRFGDGWPIVHAPLSETAFCEPTPVPDGINNIIFTSQIGVDAFARQSRFRDAVAWCVGEKTGKAAANAGFSATVGPGTAAGLADRIIADGSVTKVYYPRGEDVAYQMKVRLNSAGIETMEAVVYRQITSLPTPEAIDLLADRLPVLAPLFSPKVARLFGKAFPTPTAPLLVAAISQPVAIAAKMIRKKDCVVADHPDTDHMLLALAVLVARNAMP